MSLRTLSSSVFDLDALFFTSSQAVQGRTT